MENTNSVPFKGTKEQEARLREVIAAHKGEQGATIPVPQGAGYLRIPAA